MQLPKSRLIRDWYRLGLVLVYLIVALRLWIPGFRAELISHFRHECLTQFRHSKGRTTSWRHQQVTHLKTWYRKRGQGWLGEGLIGLAVLHVPMIGISLVTAVTIVSVIAQR